MITRKPVDSICCCLCIPIVGHATVEGSEERVLTWLFLLRKLALDIDTRFPSDNLGGKLFDDSGREGGEKQPA